MSVCPQCETDAHLRLQRRDGEPGYQCDKCGTWMLFGALPPKVPDRSRAQAHKASPGRWPEDFPLDAAGKVEEGLVVRSKSGTLEGRTTGARQRCTSLDCPGWFIAVTWESGQALQAVLAGLDLRPRHQDHPDHRRRRDLRPLRLPGAARHRPAPQGAVAGPRHPRQAQGLAHHELTRRSQHARLAS